MVKKIMLFIIITNFLNIHLLFADRIGDMRDKIEEEKERQEEEEHDDDSSGGGCLGGGFFSSYDEEDDDDDSSASDVDEYDLCLMGFFESFGQIRYAGFPYDPRYNYNFVGLQSQSPDNEKIHYAQVDVEGMYLFEDTYGLNAKASINMVFVRIHCFYQYVFDPDDYFNVFSGNAGVTIPIADGMLHIFVGFYVMDLISSVTFSKGIEFTYFFPANLIFDVYYLNTVFGELGFHTLTCTVSYAVGNLSFGAGFNLNSYAEEIFMGPMLKVTLWI
ncbi:MAG: hypothetical protein JW822_14660 [Spirochaetales bacterium]|nr:hypothetical protein [Spirochaetales bacterium]